MLSRLAAYAASRADAAAPKPAQPPASGPAPVAPPPPPQDAPTATGGPVSHFMPVQTTAVSMVGQLLKGLSHRRPYRSFNVTHASDVTDPKWCPRMGALFMASGTLPKDRYVAPAMQVTFANGDALADLVANRWMEDRALGAWNCLRCNHTRTGRKPPEVEPHTSCKHLWKYRELKFHWDEPDISGSIDLFADLGHHEGKMTVVELKTKSAEDFKTLSAPEAEHRERTNLYLAILRAQKTLPFPIDLDQARVLYISRGHGIMSPEHGNILLPFKEYVINFNEADTHHAVARAKVMKKYRADKKVPERTCQDSFTPPAKWCPANALCFSGKY